jgi:glycosyltransferase involved in cell wall biosynthesis
MQPLFSIVLPTYNRAYVLWRAILSVLAQTEPRWELLVVDDGSTDCTQRLLEEFKDDRVKVIKSDNRGPAAARNLGARAATSPYIAYLDSDNSWPPTYLEAMRQATLDHPDSVLWYSGQRTTIWHRSADGIWTKRSEDVEPRSQYSLLDACDLKGADANCIVHRRAILAEVGGWDEKCRWLEDWDFFLRCMLLYPHRITWSPGVLVEYRQVHGSGADGICGEAREGGYQEFVGRQYLLNKWRERLSPSAVRKLGMTVDELLAKRDKALLKQAG